MLPSSRKTKGVTAAIMVVCPETSSVEEQIPSCPYCESSERVVRFCKYYRCDPPIQRYKCKSCERTFSEKTVINKPNQNIEHQISVLDKEMKNLVPVKPQKVLQGIGKTKSNLVNFSWHLKKLGRSEPTIVTYLKRLKSMARYCDLTDPEEVKGVIATKYKNKGTQQLSVYAYDAFLKFVGGKWIKPKYTPEHKTKFIPTDKERELAVNCGTHESIVYKALLDETGARRNEGQRLEWKDINTETCKVTLKSSKGGKSRTLKVSRNLINMLNSLPRLPNQTEVFRQTSLSGRSNAFRNQMKRLANIHKNPRFLEITLHTFRHCFALRTYHKYREVLKVKNRLGHKNIQTTMIYIDLYEQIYGDDTPRKFVTKIASTKQERIELINNDWDLVSKDGDDWYFRKPE